MPSSRGKVSVSKAIQNVIQNVHTHRQPVLTVPN